MPAVVVEQVLAPVTYGLRQEVLRPGMRPAEVGFVGDDDPAASHFAAYDAEGRIVGVVAVLPEATPAGAPGWRLRGMAVAEAVRGQGVGAALVERVADAVGRLGGGLLWCQARLAAAGFYAALGFVTHGEQWSDPTFGPHVPMAREVEPVA